jgi:hypothetical protein
LSMRETGKRDTHSLMSVAGPHLTCLQSPRRFGAMYLPE